jgi:cation diffusion facilitator CzcD-associated flavoprotein CzcO
MSERATEVDAVVVGAGFSGLYMLHRLRGLGLSVRVLDRAAGVGGTWFWNRYPGARCDIESADYAYSFSEDLVRDWTWSERYAAQPEILAYLDHVADRFDLRRDIEFETRVVTADFDDGAGRWTLVTDGGARYRARFCVMATGCLSSVREPDVPGLGTFRGAWLVTGRWPDGIDLGGRRVAFVGTGSTGIQAIPELARQAEQLYVFQRTANYSLPARNRPLGDGEMGELRRGFAERRGRAVQSAAGMPVEPPLRSALEIPAPELAELYEAGWERGGIEALSYAATDIVSDATANRTAQEFVRAKIRSIVRDPAVAELLCPRHFIGTKRTCVDTDYYDTFNRANVQLIDARADPIEEITADGVRTRGGDFYAVDAIVFAIGFDAMTGALRDIAIRGAGGVELRETWAAGPRTLLGLAVAGFPNLFLVTGPGSPSVLSNMAVSIEQHVDFIADAIGYLRANGLDRIEATEEAQDAWVAHVNDLAEETLYPATASWYTGANVPGKPRVFMPYVGGCGPFRQRCDEVARRGYEGFALS